MSWVKTLQLICLQRRQRRGQFMTIGVNAYDFAQFEGGTFFNS